MRNIQLVTPALTRWISPSGYTDYTGHIGILSLQVLEPGRVVLLAASMAVLVLLQRSRRR